MSSETSFDNEKYDLLLKDHEKKAKRILKTNLSTNENTLRRYEIDILRAHNEIVTYARIFLEKFDKESKEIVRKEINQVKEKTSRCIERLQVSINLPSDPFETINVASDIDSGESINYSEDEEEFSSANSTHNLTLSEELQNSDNAVNNTLTNSNSKDTTSQSVNSIESVVGQNSSTTHNKTKQTKHMCIV